MTERGREEKKLYRRSRSTCRTTNLTYLQHKRYMLFMNTQYFNSSLYSLASGSKKHNKNKTNIKMEEVKEKSNYRDSIRI